MFTDKRSEETYHHYKEEVKKEMERLAKETPEGEQPTAINYVDIWLLSVPTHRIREKWFMAWDLSARIASITPLSTDLLHLVHLSLLILFRH